MIKDTLRTNLILLSSIVVFGFPTSTHAQDRPNIILLMGDDHGWEETGYNGHPYLHTPVLDEMASSGLQFNRFYAAHPTCSPTRGSVLTGRHPNRYGTFAPNWSIRPDEITIADLLREAGYATGHFGKWHVGPVKIDSPTNPGAMGFDQWLSHDNFFELNPVLSSNGDTPSRIEGESSSVLVDAAIDFISNSQASEQPFFAVVWFGSPHEPYSGLDEDLELYDNLPGRYAEKIVALTSNHTGLQTRRPLREVLRERYAEITAMDRAIGKLRDYLERAGLKNNTLLWYKGDNGTPASGLADSPLRGLKGTMYEEGIRVPSIIEWPARIHSSRTTHVPAVTSDILPTLATLAGQNLPSRVLDGINLEPLIDNAMRTRPEPIFFWGFNIGGLNDRNTDPYIPADLQEGTTPLVKLMDGIPTRIFQNFHYSTVLPRDYLGPRVVLDNDYKLVVQGSTNSSTELFNITNDPGETTDLSEREPAIVDAMQHQLREWQESTLNSLTGDDYR